MATPKFDRILQEFHLRIGDPISILNGIATASKILTVSESCGYVNKAMFSFFETNWDSVGGDKQKFIEIFPELLVVTSSITTSTTTYSATTIQQYTASNPNLDIYRHYGVTTGSQYIRIWPKQYVDVAITQKNTHFNVVPPDKAAVEIGTRLLFFPTGSTEMPGMGLTYIRQPLDNTTGALLQQNGNVDSPFDTRWTTKLAEIAASIYTQDAQFK